MSIKLSYALLNLRVIFHASLLLKYPTLFSCDANVHVDQGEIVVSLVLTAIQTACLMVIVYSQ